jgi:hypothetical protein
MYYYISNPKPRTTCSYSFSELYSRTVWLSHRAIDELIVWKAISYGVGDIFESLEYLCRLTKHVV